MIPPVKIFSGKTSLPLAKKLLRVTVSLWEILSSLKTSDGEFIRLSKKQLGVQSLYLRNLPTTI